MRRALWMFAAFVLLALHVVKVADERHEWSRINVGEVLGVGLREGPGQRAGTLQSHQLDQCHHGLGLLPPLRPPLQVLALQPLLLQSPVRVLLLQLSFHLQPILLISRLVK